MSNAANFVNAYANQIEKLIQDLLQLQSMNQELTDDSTLITRYFQTTTPVPRADIVAQDITNAQNAIVQMLFTFNSGTPSQAAALYKMTP